jgi:predicted cation transporter
VEEQLEVFFLLVGAVAVSLQGFWSPELVWQALREPLSISAMVLAFGLGFRALRLRVRVWTGMGQRILGPRWLAFILVVGLGLLSSLITSIVAALVLAEVVSALKLPRQAELRLVILACFAIGAGSALTPLGGPLAAIAVSRLQGDPYHADFFFLGRILGPWVLPLIGAFGLAATILVHGPDSRRPGLREDAPETLRDILLRAFKVYGFVAGLVLFGCGFAPLADHYLSQVPSLALYWINSLSAVLDNATLSATEIGPQLSVERIRALLLGLLVAGGMLVPGNIPNIVCAAKLRLGAKEWAIFALPLGLVTMIVVFAVLVLV